MMLSVRLSFFPSFHGTDPANFVCLEHQQKANSTWICTPCQTPSSKCSGTLCSSAVLSNSRILKKKKRIHIALLSWPFFFFRRRRYGRLAGLFLFFRLFAFSHDSMFLLKTSLSKWLFPLQIMDAMHWFLAQWDQSMNFFSLFFLPFFFWFLEWFLFLTECICTKFA